MPPPYQSCITISAGEECTIVGSGVVRLQLQSGVVEVAGVLLRAKEPSAFPVDSDRRCVVLYTLEGGSVLATADAPFEAHRAQAGAAPVVQLCRRALCGERRSAVLVVGRAGSGKTLAAHTMCNALRGASAAAVLLLDLNAESNALFAPGCVSAALVDRPLWPPCGGAPLRTFSLFTGSAERPQPATAAAFLHFAAQLRDCAEPLLAAAAAAPSHTGGPATATAVAATATAVIVIDAPAPAAGVWEGAYYRRLVDALRPSHVVVVAARDGTEEWAAFLQEDAQRAHPDCEFLHVPPVARPCASSAAQQLREARLCEYFVGTPAYPLACAKAVVPAGLLVFLRYEARAEPDAGGVPRCVRVEPTQALAGCVCALSHAAVAEEVPLAPIAGLLLIVAVDEEHEEVVAVLPAGGDSLPRRFVIVPNEGEAETLRVAEQLAHIEEAVVV